MNYFTNAGRAYVRLLVIAVLVCVVVVATSPIWGRIIALSNDHRSMRIDNTVARLRGIYEDVCKYRLDHAGSNPPSLDSLAKLGYGEGLRHFWNADYYRYVYFPKAKGDETLVMCQYVTNPSNIVFWVTASGRVYVGRARVCRIIWPKWDFTEKDRPIRPLMVPTRAPREFRM